MPRFSHWPPQSVTNLESNLENLANLLYDPTLSTEARSWLSRMLVVRSCGYVEQSLFEMTLAYIQEKSGGTVRSFAQSFVQSGKNPSPQQIAEHLGRFDQLLQDDFIAFIDSDDERLKRELSFLVDRRNKIAHGINEGVNQAKALDLHVVAVEVVEWLTLRLNPGR